MTFREKYAALECEFQEQVERDNKDLEIESSYVHNFIPTGSVDYVLVGMEPSTGVPGPSTEEPERGGIDPSQMDRNFSWSVEDFILHYCIRQYLCQGNETYHLTDLAKGGMTTRLADKQRQHRYEMWYPLLEKELRLLNKPGGTRVIAIGNKVADFLKKKSLCVRVKKILHYSRRVREDHRDRAIAPWHKQFPGFSRSVDNKAFKKAFEKSIDDVLKDAGMVSYIGHRPEGGKTYSLTESRKKLMFYYKNRFSELRGASNIVLNLGQGR